MIIKQTSDPNMKTKLSLQVILKIPHSARMANLSSLLLNNTIKKTKQKMRYPAQMIKHE